MLGGIPVYLNWFDPDLDLIGNIRHHKVEEIHISLGYAVNAQFRRGSVVIGEVLLEHTPDMALARSSGQHRSFLRIKLEVNI